MGSEEAKAEPRGSTLRIPSRAFDAGSHRDAVYWSPETGVRFTSFPLAHPRSRGAPGRPSSDSGVAEHKGDDASVAVAPLPFTAAPAWDLSELTLPEHGAVQATVLRAPGDAVVVVYPTAIAFASLTGATRLPHGVVTRQLGSNDLRWFRVSVPQDSALYTVFSDEACCHKLGTVQAHDGSIDTTLALADKPLGSELAEVFLQHASDPLVRVPVQLALEASPKLYIGDGIYGQFESIGLRIVRCQWHPLMDSCLFVLSTDRRLRVFDVRCSIDDPIMELRVSSQSVAPAVDFAFGTGAGWEQFTVYILCADGQVLYLCPVVPLGCVIPRHAWEELSASMHDTDNPQAVETQAWLQQWVPCDDTLDCEWMMLPFGAAIGGQASSQGQAAEAGRDWRSCPATSLVVLPSSACAWPTIARVFSDGMLEFLVSAQVAGPRWRSVESAKQQRKWIIVEQVSVPVDGAATPALLLDPLLADLLHVVHAAGACSVKLEWLQHISEESTAELPTSVLIKHDVATYRPAGDATIDIVGAAVMLGMQHRNDHDLVLLDSLGAVTVVPVLAQYVLAKWADSVRVQPVRIPTVLQQLLVAEPFGKVVAALSGPVTPVTMDAKKDMVTAFMIAASDIHDDALTRITALQRVTEHRTELLKAAKDAMTQLARQCKQDSDDAVTNMTALHKKLGTLRATNRQLAARAQQLQTKLQRVQQQQLSDAQIRYQEELATIHDKLLADMQFKLKQQEAQADTLQHVAMPRVYSGWQGDSSQALSDLGVLANMRKAAVALEAARPLIDHTRGTMADTGLLAGIEDLPLPEVPVDPPALMSPPPAGSASLVQSSEARTAPLSPPTMPRVEPVRRLTPAAVTSPSPAPRFAPAPTPPSTGPGWQFTPEAAAKASGRSQWRDRK